MSSITPAALASWPRVMIAANSSGGGGVSGWLAKRTER